MNTLCHPKTNLEHLQLAALMLISTLTNFKTHYHNLICFHDSRVFFFQDH
uniref:Uncharacterized protein n=1 Tax=Rhizophora mucronata TaxID=61149 RepID=A0A2P2Q6X1_RHIMU